MELPAELTGKAALWLHLKRWEKRELAQQLRGLGLLYREIREIIPVPKGTLSDWCRDVELTPEQQTRLQAASHRAATARAVGARNRKRNLVRIAAIRQTARLEAENLRGDPFWTAGVVAYWAEGSKDQELTFSNSDPLFVMLFIHWAFKYLGVTGDRLTIAMHLHDGQDEGERRAFWSGLTGVPQERFGKTFMKPHGSGHRKKVLYNGTIRVRIDRSGDLFHRVMGWIEWFGESEWVNVRGAQ